MDQDKGSLKDKYGREVTKDTKISDLPEELAKKITGKLTLGQIFFSKVLSAHEKGERPLPIDEWGEQISRDLGVIFTPTPFKKGSTTYKQFGSNLGINDEQMHKLLKAFGIEDVQDLLSVMDENHANILGLKKAGSCFVATAVYSDPSPEVYLLRRFRDNYLVTTKYSQVFIEWYYRNGAVLADWVSVSSLRRSLALLFLKPLILVINMFMKIMETES